jgi:hypothetical protein
MAIPKDALTIHLYQYEEVVASFIWSLIRHRSRDAIFWALELFDSAMMDGIFSVLSEVWVQYIGFGEGCLSILGDIEMCRSNTDAENGLSRDTWVLCVYKWSTLKSADITGLQLLIRGHVTPSAWTIQFPHTKEYTSVELALSDCLMRGKMTEAWIIARAMRHDEIVAVTQYVCEKRGRSQDAALIQTLPISNTLSSLALIILSSISEVHLKAAHVIPPFATTLPQEIQAAVDDWDSESRMRSRRSLKTLPEAIALCSRSLIPSDKTNAGDICANLEENLMKSPCWQIVLEDYLDGTEWKSDLYKEMFYDTYFPFCTDDIPDEWSAKDREQSHGPGFGKSIQTSMRQYINNIIRNRSCIGLYSIITNVSSEIFESSDWSHIYTDLHTICRPILENALPFKPLEKRLDGM